MSLSGATLARVTDDDPARARPSPPVRPRAEVPLLAVVLDFDGAEWIPRANCRGVNPDLFFPERGGSSREGKEICAKCEVRAECLDFAIRHRIVHGLWGGESERERARLRRRLRQTG